MKAWKSFLATLTTAGLISLNSINSSAQDAIYKYSLNLFGAKLGEMKYNRSQKNLEIKTIKWVDVTYSYSMPNDSTYIEENITSNKHEVYTYLKSSHNKDNSNVWVLDDYEVLRGEENLEKKVREKKPYGPSVLNGIESLEKVFAHKLNNINETVVFGIPYTIKIKDSNKNNQEAIYVGNIQDYQKNKEDEFLFEDDVVALCEKKGNYYVPKEIAVEVKIWKFLPATAKIKLIQSPNYLTAKSSFLEKSENNSLVENL